MKIVNLIPGTGGSFYCENCMRDASLIAGLKAIGHHVTMMPMYLPISYEELGVNEKTPVFFGAINVYLKQILSIYRKAPRWLERILDAQVILKLAARKSSSTSAHGLEEMTLSMLKGEKGNQASELDDLIHYLKTHEKPEVIHLSNALLLGLAHRIKDELNVPIVCSLQDEEPWIEEMDAKYKPQLWQLIKQQAHHVDAFIAVSQFYADSIQKRLDVDENKMHIIPIGIDLDGFGEASLEFNPPIIGYLSRICESHGLDILANAFIKIKQERKTCKAVLHITGGHLAEDNAFIKKVKAKLTKEHVMNDVVFYEQFDRTRRQKFLESLSVLSVPMKEPAAIGAFQYEALATGVPVVQPKMGGFTEVVEATGGGIIYEPNDADTLAENLLKVLLDPRYAKKLGKSGRKAVHEKYNNKVMAEKISNIYESIRNK